MQRLFEQEKQEQGFIAGVNKNLNEINEYVKPVFNKIGYELFPIRGENIRKALKISDSKEWSQMTKRLQNNGSGNLHKCYAYEKNEHWINMQILCVDNVKQIGKKARWNIPRDIVDATPVNKLIQTSLQSLKVCNIYLFLFVKTGWFIFIKYEDIPPDGWILSYRGKASRPNRMYIKTDYLERALTRVENLPKILEYKFVK